MREKHSKISILVFAVTTVLLFGFFMLTTSQAFADKGYKGKGKQEEWQKQDTHDRRDYKERPDNSSRSGYKKRPDYHKHRGYRERPYDKRRHYRHYDYKGHQYGYQGHWRSWEQWDRYAKKHPHIYKRGRYYRENTHLMFRFCEPGTGSCFFFSIGR
jgi:hypothetical protein